MAYSFLNTTTYTRQLEDQENLLAQMMSNIDTPVGAGMDLADIDSDLIEITTREQEASPISEELVEQESIEDDFFAEVDDKADMELLDMIFEEEATPQRQRTRTPSIQPIEEPEEESNSGTTYRPNGKVTPRIYQYGGKTPKYQFGGDTLYANDYETQRIGLNNPNYNTAVFNTKGSNTFRGLDNHQPVAVTDGSKYKVLYGPQDTAKFSGKVYEKRLNNFNI
jgi:hypothetical protein